MNVTGNLMDANYIPCELHVDVAVVFAMYADVCFSCLNLGLFISIREGFSFSFAFEKKSVSQLYRRSSCNGNFFNLLL